jgi:hypothetical protein
LKNDFIKINEVLRLFPNNTPETIDQIQRLKQAIIQLSSENQALETRVDVIQGKMDGILNVSDPKLKAIIDSIQYAIKEQSEAIKKLTSRHLR